MYHKPSPIPQSKSEENTLQNQSQKTPQNLHNQVKKDPMAQLHQAIGNRAMGNLIQAKSEIIPPNHPSEREADKVAKTVTQYLREHKPDYQPKPSLNIDMGLEEMPTGDETVTPQPIQRKSTNLGALGNTDIGKGIKQAQGKGKPLDKSIKAPMEKAFGTDFSGVRIHNHTQSDQLNRSIGAKAFTTGTDIFFQRNAYQPNQQQGKSLLAHELTHVVQQNGATLSGNSPINPKLETQAPGNLATQINQNTSHPVIQRYMGFEFQTVSSGTKFVDGEGEKKIEESDKLIYKGKGWEMKSDSGDLECITDHQHVPETKKGKANLGIIMRDIEAKMEELRQAASNKPNNRLTKEDIKNTLALDQESPYPKMESNSYLQVQAPITAHPQATVGMELDKIPDLMTTLTNNDANTTNQLVGWATQGYYTNMKAPVQQAVNNIPTALQNQDISAKRKLQGVIALISSQVRTIKEYSRTHDETNYPKTAFSFMLRNPLSTIFDLLESEDKELLKTAVENEDAQLLTSLGVNDLENTQLWDIALNKLDDDVSSDFTIQEWLSRAFEGTELMGDEEWHGIGEVSSTELGGTQVNPYKRRQGAILEARHIADKYLPLAQWKNFAKQFFDEVVSISQDVNSSGWEIGDHQDLQELDPLIDEKFINEKRGQTSELFKLLKSSDSNPNSPISINTYQDNQKAIQKEKEYIQQLIEKVDNYPTEKQLLQNLLTEIDQTLVEVNQKIQELKLSNLEDDTTETHEDTSQQVLDDSVIETETHEDTSPQVLDDSVIETETEIEIDYRQYLEEDPHASRLLSKQKANIDLGITTLKWNPNVKESIQQILLKQCFIPEQYHEDIISNWQEVKQQFDL